MYPPLWDSLVAQMLKHLPAIQETQVLFLGREDPLEKAIVTHSGTLAWKIPWTEEPGGLQSMVSKSRTRLSDFTFFLHHCVSLSSATFPGNFIIPLSQNFLSF